MRELLPLAQMQDAVVAFLRGRDDAVLFGATAVNTYADQPRMTEDVDVLATDAEHLAEQLRAHLAEKFHIAVRVRDLGPDKGLRVYQLAEPRDRHLVDVRRVATLPPKQKVDGVWVVEPAELVAMKVMAFAKRGGKPKAFTDRRDLAVLLLKYPKLKTYQGPVRQRLEAAGADEKVLASWDEIVSQEIVAEREDEDLDW